MPKRDGRRAFYAIHSMLLGPNHVNTTASEAEAEAAEQWQSMAYQD